MKKLLYLPLAAVVGAASLTVWAQANAGPPADVAPGVVVADVEAGDDNSVDAAPTHYPTASAAALPEQEPKETQRVEAELQTYPPDQVAGTPEAYDDKGGLRPDGVSDDGPLHDLGDDKGGLRPDGASDDGPGHDLGDDKGGER